MNKDNVVSLAAPEPVALFDPLAALLRLNAIHLIAKPDVAIFG